MADVIVIFNAGECELMDDESLAMSFAATNIERLHSGALSCTVPSWKLHEIERRPGVAYVRRVQAYLASLSA